MIKEFRLPLDYESVANDNWRILVAIQHTHTIGW
jgi:hypothetical protein